MVVFRMKPFFGLEFTTSTFRPRPFSSALAAQPGTSLQALSSQTLPSLTSSTCTCGVSALPAVAIPQSVHQQVYALQGDVNSPARAHGLGTGPSPT